MNKILIDTIGSDLYQIDGVGGGSTITSKIAIVNKSNRADADVDYQFAQLLPGKSTIHTKLNCGNILSAVAPFAVENGLVKAKDPETTVRIFNTNTGTIVHARIPTFHDEPQYSTSPSGQHIYTKGVPVTLNFMNLEETKCSGILPTNQIRNYIDDIEVSCINSGVPLVILKAKDLGKTGYETKAALENDLEFMKKLEMLRCKAADLMGLGNVSGEVFPKVCMVASSKQGKTAIVSRYFTPVSCHEAHAMTGAICLATACLIHGSVANELIERVEKGDNYISIEHPSGVMRVRINVSQEKKKIIVNLAEVITTARLIFKGHVFIVE